MAVRAKSHGPICRIPEELDRIRAVRVVATAAVKPFVRSFRVLHVLPADGMTGVRDALDRMRFLFHGCMALKADIDRFLLEQRRGIGRVRPVTEEASPRGHRRVDVLFGELRLVMAGKAEAGNVLSEEFRLVRRVRIVAAGTAHANGCMDVLFREHCFIVASKAQIGLFRGQSFPDLVLHLMRDVTGVHGTVTGRASHVNGGMLYFFAHQVRMACEAVDFFGKAAGTGTKECEQRNDCRKDGLSQPNGFHKMLLLLVFEGALSNDHGAKNIMFVC
jgi:hypothetical protein